MTTTSRSDHPALKGLALEDVTDEEFKHLKIDAHKHLMAGTGMMCYCYQELMKAYKEVGLDKRQ